MMTPQKAETMINYNQIQQDKDLLISFIWKHQETLGNGPIEDRVLRYLTGWNYYRFERTLYLLLIDPETEVRRTPSGRIEYIW